MNDSDKTREELVKELQKVRKELAALKAPDGKYITGNNPGEEPLMLSEENFRVIFENNSAAMAVIEPDTTISMVNEEYCRLSGYTRKEVIGMSWTRQIPPGDLERMKEYNRLRMINPKDVPVKYEFTFYCKSGEIRHAMMSITMLSNRKRIASFYDITERKQAEEALLTNEEKYRNLFENVQDVYYQTDLAGIIHDISPSVKLFTSLSREEIIGTSVYDLYYDPGERERMLDSIKKNGELRDYELRFRVKDGEIKVASVNARLVCDAGGRPEYIDGSLRDITDRKLAENALHESESRFRTLIEQSPVAISISRDGTGLYANQKCLQLFGLQNVEQYINRPVFEIFSPQLQEESKNRSRLRSLGLPVVDEFESVGMRADGSRFPIQVSVKGVKLSDGMANVAFVFDITERKQFEMELIRAKEHAEESDRLKSAFLANMSHEIRTPMNGILGFAGLLKEPQLTGEEQQLYISVIERSGKRMLNIINNIVSISKIEAGQMEVSISETNINEQIQFIYNFFKPEVERKGMKFVINCTLPSEESIIRTDSEKLYAILGNLVGNALKFTEAGSVGLGYEKKGNFLEFSVKDTGEGIQQEMQEIIFERFRQGTDLTSRFNEGAGLGLSISKAYVEMLGGKIRVESEPGKGSVFYFTLPYNAVPETNTIVRDAGPVNGEKNHVTNLKILVAEDDEASQNLMTAVMNKFGKEILKAETGLEAVEACRTNPDIDLVLMDIRMPGMDGYEATRRIRQFNKAVIIIAQTAYGLSGDREKAIEAGCNDYISKPINLSLLRMLIQKYFKKQQTLDSH